MSLDLSATRYQAAVPAEELARITADMSPIDKSSFLWLHTNWPRPRWALGPVLLVPDPDGRTHQCRSSLDDDSGWQWTCSCGGTTASPCWAIHHARRAYYFGSGQSYQDSTGDSLYNLRPSAHD